MTLSPHLRIQVWEEYEISTSPSFPIQYLEKACTHVQCIWKRPKQTFCRSADKCDLNVLNSHLLFWLEASWTFQACLCIFELLTEFEEELIRRISIHFRRASSPCSRTFVSVQVLYNLRKTPDQKDPPEATVKASGGLLDNTKWFDSCLMLHGQQRAPPSPHPLRLPRGGPTLGVGVLSYSRHEPCTNNNNRLII